MRLVWMAMAVVGIGCDGESDDGQVEELGPICQEIVEACHEPGEAGDAASEACHETGHEGDEDVCETERDVCIATCEAAATG